MKGGGGGGGRIRRNEVGGGGRDEGEHLRENNGNYGFVCARMVVVMVGRLLSLVTAMDVRALCCGNGQGEDEKKRNGRRKEDMRGCSVLYGDNVMFQTINKQICG